jgi:hypothetical protein
MSQRQGSALPAGGASGPGERNLLQRLLQTFARPDRRWEQHDTRQPLAPAGQRSGTGVRSIEVYLEETRHTTPGPLE